jgi:hypothetical protein
VISSLVYLAFTGFTAVVRGFSMWMREVETQLEHRMIAESIKKIFTAQFRVMGWRIRFLLL